MHVTSVLWLRVAVVLYSIGLFQTIFTVIQRRAQMFSGVLLAFQTAVILHSVSLTEVGLETGRFPALNFFESISLCALLIALVFLFVNWRYQFQSLSVILFPLVFLMTLIGAMQFPMTSWSSSSYRGFWLLVHVALALLGYAALLLTAVASLFYLLQERQLKSKRQSAFFERLPPLATLDELISKSMAVGFILITAGVVVGTLWAYSEDGIRWLGDPRVTMFYVTWASCLVMVTLRINAGWRGRKAAVMAITVLVCAAVSWAAHTGLRTLFVQGN